MTPIPSKPELEQVDPPKSPWETLPTMCDLPSENPQEPGLPDGFHDLQPQLLSRTLRLGAFTRDRGFTASDLNLYYDVNHPLWYKRPDWFLVVDVPRLYDGKELRRSYVTWQEGRNPDGVIEFLSPGTEAEDLGPFHSPPIDLPAGNGTAILSPGEELPRLKTPAKFEVYERYLRVPHYLVYSPYTQQLRYFKLEGGRYEEHPLQAENPIVWFADLNLGLGLWEGIFEAVPGFWLRWCDRSGNWLLTDTERAEAQVLQAARTLMATGMGIEQVTQLMGLSESQVQALRPLPE